MWSGRHRTPCLLQISSFSNLSVTSPTSQLILQPFRRFTNLTAHSPILWLLYLRHSSSPTLFRFSYVTSSAHSPIFPSLHLRHNSFSNPSVALPTLQLILQSFRCFTYITVYSPTLPSLLLRHKLCSFSNLSVTSPTSQLILQSFRCFTYITAHSPTLLSLLLLNRLFTYVTWRAAHVRIGFLLCGIWVCFRWRI